MRSDFESSGRSSRLLFALALFGAALLSFQAEQAHAQATAPGAPTTLEAEGGVGVITLTWQAPADDGGSAITGYRIESAPDMSGSAGTFADLEDDTGSTDLTYTHEGLSAGVTMHYRVSAINGEGTGAASGEASATTFDVPDAPGAIGVTQGAGMLTLTWAAPADDGGSPVTGYRIESAPDMSGSAGAFTELVDDTGSTDITYVHEGLDPGETVHYRVSAINEVGTGAASGEATATTFEVPGAPTGLAAQRGTGVITLNWVAPTADGGSAITGYRIESAPDMDGSAGTFTDLVEDTTDTTGTDTTYMHSGLDAGVTLHYRVSAISAAGTGAASGEATATTFDVPAAPTGLAAQRGVGVITLTWAAPMEDGGTAITGYRIESAPDASGSAGTFTDLVEDTTGTDTTYMHSGLDAGVTMHYRVSAINAVGTGEASASVSAATAEVPSAVTALAGERGVGVVTLTWTAPTEDGGNAVTGYRIESSATGEAGSFTDLLANTGSTDLTYTHSGLSAGQTVYYRVSAINAAGTGPASEQISVTTVEPSDAPTELVAQRGVGAITLTWTAPTEDGGSAITGYRVESAPDVSGSPGSFTILEANTGSTDPTYTHSGLAPGAALHYRVRALTGLGAGTASASIMAASATVPVDAPGDVTAERGAEAGSIVIRWTAPIDDGGDAVTGYRVESSPNGSDSGFTELVANTGSTDTSYTHTGLAPDQLVYYRVSAINGVGTGPASGQANASAPGIPGAPTDLVAQRGVASITLTWTAPIDDGGSPITGYLVESAPDMDGSAGTFTELEDDTGSADATYTHTGLTAGQTVHYRVSAINVLGTGPASDPDSSSAATAPVNAPTGLMVASDVQQLVLTWTAPSDDGGSAISGYRIEHSSSGEAGSFTDLEANTGSADTTYTHTGLGVEETEHHYRVSAINGAGTGPASTPASGTTTRVVNALSDQESLEFALEIMGRALATDMVNVLSNRFDAFDAPQQSLRLAAQGGNLPLGAHAHSRQGGMATRLLGLAGVLGLEARAEAAAQVGAVGRSGFGASAGWLNAAAQDSSLLHGFGFGDGGRDAAAFRPGAVSGTSGETLRLSFSPDALLEGGAFSWRPGAAAAQSNAAHAEGGEADGVWTVWWRGSQALFKARRDERGANNFSVDGDVLSAYLGMDVHWNRKWLTGAALSYGRAEVEYESSAKGSDGTWEIDLLTFLPYLRWSPREDLHLFGMVGIGFGESEFSETLVDPGEPELDLRMAALGVKNALASIRGIDLSVKADYLSVRMESGATDHLPESSVTSERARLALSGDTRWEPREDAGYFVETNLALGVRVDGGEHETGSGTEIGAGISYTYPEHGLQLALKGRMLLAHTHGDYREEGITLTADFDPGSRGEGMFFSLRPSWGNPDADVDAFYQAEGGIFSGDALARAAGRGRGRLDLGFGYGIAMYDGGALLTPFGEFGRGGAYAERVRFGLRLSLQERAAARALGVGELRALQLRIFGEQRSRDARPSEQHIGLGVNLEF